MKSKDSWSHHFWWKIQIDATALPGRSRSGEDSEGFGVAEKVMNLAFSGNLKNRSWFWRSMENRNLWIKNRFWRRFLNAFANSERDVACSGALAAYFEDIVPQFPLVPFSAVDWHGPVESNDSIGPLKPQLDVNFRFRLQKTVTIWLWNVDLLQQQIRPWVEFLTLNLLRLTESADFGWIWNRLNWPICFNCFLNASADFWQPLISDFLRLNWLAQSSS